MAIPVFLQYQGYRDDEPAALEPYQLGLRFYPGVCALLMALATFYSSAPAIFAIAFVALLSVFLPHHPLDYFWNAVVTNLGFAKIPPTTPARRVSCSLAVTMLLATGVCFFFDYFTLGFILGTGLSSAALFKALTHYCIIAHLHYLLISPKSTAQSHP